MLQTRSDSTASGLLIHLSLPWEAYAQQSKGDEHRPKATVLGSDPTIQPAQRLTASGIPPHRAMKQTGGPKASRQAANTPSPTIRGLAGCTGIARKQTEDWALRRARASYFQSCFALLTSVGTPGAQCL